MSIIVALSYQRLFSGWAMRDVESWRGADIAYASVRSMRLAHNMAQPPLIISELAAAMNIAGANRQPPRPATALRVPGGAAEMSMARRCFGYRRAASIRLILMMRPA